MNLKTRSEIEMDLDGEKLVFRADGSLYLPKYRTVLVADLHLGKEASFRTAGLPVPRGLDHGTFGRLNRVIESTECEQVIVLGDLIHNRHSFSDGLAKALDEWRYSHASIKLVLVKGNHDRYLGKVAHTWFDETNDGMEFGSFWLTHDPQTEHPSRVIGGHIHPVTNVGKIDQMRCRCFAIDRKKIVLPAFGAFTGGHRVSARNLQHCLAIKEV
ncbi:MAG: ligase-associated DNA damage response endonuclease PdeM, partial [Planctomycetota bacterium]